MERQVPSYGQCFASLAVGLAPIFLILGVAAVFGANTVTWNGQNIYGVPALFVAAGLNMVFAAIFAGLQKLGYWLLGLVRRDRTAAST
jgi:hypothetical protein